MAEIKVWTEENIEGLIDSMDRNLLIRPLKRLWDRQTAEEQASWSTNNHNGVGYSKVDAPFAGRMIEWYERKGFFSPKQADNIRRMLKKYRGQLADIATQVEVERAGRDGG